MEMKALIAAALIAASNAAAQPVAPDIAVQNARGAAMVYCAGDMKSGGHDCEKAQAASAPDDGTADLFLIDTNFVVNHALVPLPVAPMGKNGYPAIIPPQGIDATCTSFAIAKRRALIAAGFPAGAFALATLHIEGSDVDHMVLLLNAGDGRIVVLDSLMDFVGPIRQLPATYHWQARSAWGDLWSWQEFDGRAP